MDKKLEKHSLGWLLFWFIFFPPIGYIWLFTLWVTGHNAIKKAVEEADFKEGDELEAEAKKGEIKLRRKYG